MSTSQYSIFQILAAMLGEGHIRIFGTAIQYTMDASACSAGFFPKGRTMAITEKTWYSLARQGWDGLC